VWELEPQADEGDQGPVKEDEPLLGPGPGGAAAHVTAAPLQGGLVGGGPGVGQLGDQLAKLLPGDPGEDRMGEGRTSPCWHRHPCMIVWPRARPHDPL
jgi:hypothetical protein